MLDFLLDIEPGRSHLLITVGLAEALQEKKQEVYYIKTSNHAFTSTLYHKGIKNCVLYPDDFNWLRPDLTLLDCQRTVRAPFYRQRDMDYIFVAMQLPQRQSNLDANIPILYLPPSFSQLSDTGPQMEELVERLKGIKKEADRNIIIGLMENGNESKKGLTEFYKVIKKNCMGNPQYHFILLTDISETVDLLFGLPQNMEVFRILNLDMILPLCNLALTARHPDAWLDCTFAHVPVLTYSPEEMMDITPEKLEKQITRILHNKVMLVEKAKELCNFFERENRNINQIADILIERAECNRYNKTRRL